MSTVKKPLRILQVLPALVTGGVERGTLDIANALIKNGHHSYVASSGGPMVSQLENNGSTHFCLPVDSKNPFTIRKNAKKLETLIIDHKIDVIHARSRAPAWSCYWASQRTQTPFITTFHGTYGHQNSLKRLYNGVMCKGCYTIAVSEFIADHIRSIYKPKHTELKTIHRGIDTDLFSLENISNDRSNNLKATWQIPDNKPIVLFPGRLTRWKGQIDFIEAISRLKSKQLYCLIVGSDQGRHQYTEELQHLIDQHKLSNVIKLVGDCSEISTAYALADIVVSASKEPEAFGRVACEAQAMKCLTIASNHGGATETISPSQRQFLFPPGDALALSASIERAIAISKEDKYAITESSRRYIEDRFSLANMTSETITLYKACASRQKS